MNVSSQTNTLLWSYIFDSFYPSAVSLFIQHFLFWIFRSCADCRFTFPDGFFSTKVCSVVARFTIWKRTFLVNDAQPIRTLLLDNVLSDSIYFCHHSKRIWPFSYCHLLAPYVYHLIFQWYYSFTWFSFRTLHYYFFISTSCRRYRSTSTVAHSVDLYLMYKLNDVISCQAKHVSESSNV